MVEQAVIIVEPEQQRADLFLLFGIAEAADDAVRGALLLDLDHRPLARAIVVVEALGDHAVERAAAAFQPGESGIPVGGDGRQMHARHRVLCEEALQCLAPFRQRLIEQRLPAELEQIEQHQLGGRFLRELAHPAFGRMQPQLQRVERQDVADRNDELAVEQEALFRYAVRASRPLPGNSAPAACPTSTSASPLPRRVARGSGSRPTWAQIASPRLRAARRRAGLPSGQAERPLRVNDPHRRAVQARGCGRGCRTKKKPARKRAFCLVAGAGFEPATFRL